MSLLDVLRGGIKTADNITKPLQSDVSYSKAVADPGGYGLFTFPSTVTLKAIVDGRQRQVRTVEGILSVSRATVIFLDVDALSTATGGAGVSDNDKIVLPDGTTGPILATDGYTDPGTGKPVVTRVFLG